MAIFAAKVPQHCHHSILVDHFWRQPEDRKHINSANVLYLLCTRTICHTQLVDSLHNKFCTNPVPAVHKLSEEAERYLAQYIRACSVNAMHKNKLSDVVAESLHNKFCTNSVPAVHQNQHSKFWARSVPIMHDNQLSDAGRG
jgi:hypothetical protein